MLGALGGWLNVGEQLSEPVDAVMILGGGSDTRPFMAAAIYRAGYAKKILIPNYVAPPNSRHNEADIIVSVVRAHGVPSKAIVELDIFELSTRGEVIALAKYVADHPHATVAIVTSDFHTRRVRILARNAGAYAQNQLHIIACPTDSCGARDWWHTPYGLNMYLPEFAKIARDYWR